MESGYSDAILLARKKLTSLSPEKVCDLCGVKFDGEKYIIKWMSKEYNLPINSTVSTDYPQMLEIILLHYLTSEGTKQPENKLMSYREVPGALFYEPKFMIRAVNPIVKCFGKNPEKLIETGGLFGGVKSSECGDSAYALKINLLPYMPVTYIIWAGDDEFEPSGNILFDKTASGWFCAEDLVVAASLGAYELIGEYKKNN
ncbi:MAG: DUF3786 domain-containing protein [Oscillospiraceae bacterium]|nr:DUF3786 domain-containing protein [Oscillospiraceae bacterium]